MKASVNEYIRTCPACNERHREHEAPLAPEPRIAQPFAHFGVDYMEEPYTHNERKLCNTGGDGPCNKVGRSEGMPKPDSRYSRYDSFFENVVCRHDAPREIWSDRGKCFTGLRGR